MNREKRIANILLIVISLLSITALSLPMTGPIQAFKACVSYVTSPVPLAGASAARRIDAVPTGIAALLQTDMENRQLKEDMKRLPLMESELNAMRHENERLRAALGLKLAEGRVLRWAHVIERDPMNWYRNLMIDAGKDDGVEINAPVLGLLHERLGAVGRVTEMGAHWSKVLLITDEVSSIAAYLPTQGWEGLVEGQGGPQLRMNYLPLEAKFKLGDPVHTSPTSATFPPGLPIGRVTKLFQQDPFLTFQSVAVTPELQASALKEVLILQPKKLDLPSRNGSSASGEKSKTKPEQDTEEP